MLELLMADPETRIGQKIYCRSINVYANDRLEAYLDGNLIFSKDGNIDPEEMFTADYSNLTAGQHTLLVRIMTEGVERGSVSRTWTTLHDGIPRVGININNAICVDGEPFFPFTPWCLRSDNFVDSLGTAVNTLFGEGWYLTHTAATWVDYLDRGWAVGWYGAGPARWEGKDGDHLIDSDMASVANYVVSARNHPAMFAWMWDDEPDAKSDNAPGVRYLTDVTHQNDTNHPTWVNLIGYGFTRGGSGAHQDRAKEYCYLYNEHIFGQKTMVTDILGFDYYVHEYSTKFDWVNLSDYLLAFDRLQEWNYNLMPAATFVQPCDEASPTNPQLAVPVWSPPPNEAQVKNLVWLSIIHGAKAINWFQYFEWYNSDPRPNITAMQQCYLWVQDLTQVILSAPEDVSVGVTCTVPQDYRVDCMARQADEMLYIFAGEVRDWGDPVYYLPDPNDLTTAYFNIPQGTFTARFDVEGLPAGATVTVYGEGRTITSQAGYFEDVFDVHDVHIYIIQLEPEEVLASYQIAASGNDTYWYDNAQISTHTFSFCPSTNTTRGSGFIWGLDIPVGATVQAAIIEIKSNGLNAWNVDAADASLTFELLDEDSCASFAGNPPPQLRNVVAGVSATWTIPAGAWTSGTWYASCDVSALVQEFIDRPGYLPGNNIGVRAQGTGPYRKIFQFDNAPADGAILSVIYTNP